MRSAVVDRDAVRVGRGPGARVAAAGCGHDGEDRLAVVDDVIECRFDRIRRDIEFCGLGHRGTPLSVATI